MSFYDPLETRDPGEREDDLMDRLVRQIAHAKETTSHYFRLLAGINPFEVVTRDALARLPLTRKRDLMDLQKRSPPFGGLNSLPRRNAKRVFASPGPTPGAFIFEGGARKLGCSVFPGGTGQTEQQVQAIADLRPEGYVGTPSFLRIIIEKAEEIGADVSSLSKACVSGEALPGVTREWLRERGIAVRRDVQRQPARAPEPAFA